MSDGLTTLAAPKRPSPATPVPLAPVLPPAPARRGFSARTVVCIAVLAISAVSMQGLSGYFGALFRKEAIHPKKPLAAADKRKLEPEYSLHVMPPPSLPDETIQTLGTEEFLNWRIVDNTRKQSDPASVAHVFVSYYTGQPDMVPHVPDECMLAGGYEATGAENIEVPVQGVSAPGDRVPVRVNRYMPGQKRGQFGVQRLETTVMYFFHCNGKYATTRDQVRLLQANLSDRYAYYAKIEVRFSDYYFGRVASQADSVAALQPLLKRLLPILLEDHFPDWEKVKSGAAVASAAP